MKPPEAAPPAAVAAVAPLFLALSAGPTHPLSLARFESALVSSLLELGCERAPAVAPRVSRRLALASKPALTQTLKNNVPRFIQRGLEAVLGHISSHDSTALRRAIDHARSLRLQTQRAAAEGRSPNGLGRRPCQPSVAVARPGASAWFTSGCTSARETAGCSQPSGGHQELMSPEQGSDDVRYTRRLGGSAMASQLQGGYSGSPDDHDASYYLAVGEEV